MRLNTANGACEAVGRSGVTPGSCPFGATTHGREWLNRAVGTRAPLIGLAMLALSMSGFSGSAGAAQDASGLWTVGGNGSSQRLVPETDDADFIEGATWSPDGARVAFVRGS